MTALPRFDWFQTDDVVTLTILKRGAILADCRVSINGRRIIVRHCDDVVFEGVLMADVDVDSFTLTCTPSKIEIKMPKSRGGRWSNLLEVEQVQSPAEKAAGSVKNWDAIEKQVVQEEESEPSEGDQAVTSMFQKIYANATDDVKKAMIKSYQESAGTVLSTNWADIGNRKVDVQPPDMMEYKKYEQ